MKTIIFLSLFAFSVFAQPPTEKVFLQTTKTHFFVGDTLDFEVSVLSYDSIVSRVVYVELFATSRVLLQERTLRTNDNRLANHYFVIDSTLKKGTYTIRAYTHYLTGFGTKTFFTKEIQVIDNQFINKNTSILKISIEGDSLVETLPSRVMIYTASPEQSGRVIDEQGQIFAQFVTDANGLAVVPMVGILNKNYHAEVGENTLTLPRAKPKGTTIKIDTRDSLILVKCYTKSITTDSLTLLITQNDEAVFVKKTSLQVVNLYSFVKNSLPKGLLQFWVLTTQGQVLTKRLWYNGDLINISAKNRYEAVDFYLQKPLLPTNISAINSFLILNQLNKFEVLEIAEKEQYLVREGIAKDTKQNILKNQDLIIVASDKRFGIKTLTTDSLGRFWIDHIEAEGILELKIQTANEALVNVTWQPRQIPSFESSTAQTIALQSTTGWGNQTTDKQLEEVVVKARYTREKEFEKLRRNLGMVYRPEKVIEREQIIQFSDAQIAIQASVLGVTFRSNSQGKVLPYSRNSPLTLYIDGTQFDDMMFVPNVTNIERIEIVRSLSGSILQGSPLVSIITRQLHSSRTKPIIFIGNTFLKGFDVWSRK